MNIVIQIIYVINYIPLLLACIKHGEWTISGVLCLLFVIPTIGVFYSKLE